MIYIHMYIYNTPLGIVYSQLPRYHRWIQNSWTGGANIIFLYGCFEKLKTMHTIIF